MTSSRPLSQLIHFPVQENTGGPSVITMHDHNQFARDVAEWGTKASPQGRVLALESYKGVFISHDIVGYTWFLGPLERPSPIFFGDSLSEIERFLWDEVDRSGSESPELPFLLGIGQGGIMAIATALAVPELVSGVIAIDSYLPQVPGWNPPLAPLDGLPILLVNPRKSNQSGVLHGDALVSQLKDWGAYVNKTIEIPLSPDTLGVREWILRHEARTLVR